MLEKKLEMKIDKNTFGSGIAAETLAKIISERPHQSLRVSRCFHDYTVGMKSIDDVINQDMRNTLYHLWFKTNKDRVLKSTLDEDTKSFLINVEQTYMKEAIKNKGAKNAIHKERRKNEVC